MHALAAEVQGRMAFAVPEPDAAAGLTVDAEAQHTMVLTVAVADVEASCTRRPRAGPLVSQYVPGSVLEATGTTVFAMPAVDGTALALLRRIP